MSDQVVYNNPTDQPVKDDNGTIWIVIGVIAVGVILAFVFMNNGSQDVNVPVQNPQETQVPQNPQSTQIPQIPQDTQVPQNPQQTQVPQPTSIPLPTIKL